MKKIEKWATDHVWFLIILLVCLLVSIWIYQYRIERNAMLGIENVSIGAEFPIMTLPFIYLTLNWKEWAN